MIVNLVYPQLADDDGDRCGRTAGQCNGAQGGPEACRGGRSQPQPEETAAGPADAALLRGRPYEAVA